MHDLIKKQMKSSKFYGNEILLKLFKMLPFRLREYASHTLYWTLRSFKKLDCKFLIFAQGRSGSTLLIDLINSHPDVFAYGEIFDHRVMQNVNNPVRFAEGLCCLSRKPVCGFKAMIYQLERDQKQDPKKVLKAFQENGWKILYLHRDNLFHHAISDIKSDMTNTFHSYEKKDGEKNPKICIEPNLLRQTLDFRRDCEQRELKVLEDIPHLHIRYEKDLLSDESKQATLNRIFSYLGLKPHTAATRMKKVISKNLEDEIDNYRELVDGLKGSEYEKFIDYQP